MKISLDLKKNESWEAGDQLGFKKNKNSEAGDQLGLEKKESQQVTKAKTAMRAAVGIWEFKTS